MSIGSFLSTLANSVGGGTASPDEDAIQVIAKRLKRPAAAPVNFPKAPDSPPLSNGPTPPDLGNRSYIEAINAAAANAPKHSGMFGTKGTLRDVLGFLGDTYALAHGNKADYLAQREQEKQQDAMAGFTQNPYAAVERLTGVNPDAAAKLYAGQQEADAKKDYYQSVNANRADQMDQRKFMRTNALSNMAARMFASAKTPEDSKAILGILSKRAGALGIDLADLGVTPDMSPNEVQALVSGDMSVQQQRQLPIAQQNADSNAVRARAATISATRPRAGRPAPNPTNASMLYPLVTKAQQLGGFDKLSPVEQQTVKMLMPGGAKTPKRRDPPALPPGWTRK